MQCLKPSLGDKENLTIGPFSLFVATRPGKIIFRSALSYLVKFFIPDLKATECSTRSYVSLLIVGALLALATQ